MRTRTLVLAITTLLSAGGIASAQTLGSGFTYQGTFADSGQPANGNYDFEFVLYTVATGGSAVQTVTKADLAVNGGLINTVIDFGAETYNGAVRWVEVSVRQGESTGSYTALTPRQALTGVPYALGLPMPFQRIVNTGAQAAFRIAAADGGTAIEGYNPIGSPGFPAVNGISAGGVGVRGVGATGVEGAASSGVGVNGTASLTSGTGVRGSSPGGDGVRGLGMIGVHGVGQIVGVWAEGGMLSSGNVSCNQAGHCGTGIQPVLDVRNATIGNLIVARSGTPSTDVFRVNGNGSVFANGDYSAGGADVAEYVPATEALAPGDVVEIDAVNGQALRLSSHSNNSAVAGVISTRPGLTLNGLESEQEASKGMARLALSGRVPVKVTAENGTIRAGDLLVSSSRLGHAMRAPENPKAGTVIGKAMEALDGESGAIEMLVMLR